MAMWIAAWAGVLLPVSPAYATYSTLTAPAALGGGAISGGAISSGLTGSGLLSDLLSRPVSNGALERTAGIKVSGDALGVKVKARLAGNLGTVLGNAIRLNPSAILAT